MENIVFRQAIIRDLPRILEIIAGAKEVLAKQHTGQWQDQNPRASQIETDITAGHYHVLEADGRPIAGLAMLDYEPDYEELLEGAWHYQVPYMVIHRFAVDSSLQGHGYGLETMQRAEAYALAQGVTTMRVDTHERNRPMVHLLEKLGYERAGIVLLGNFKRRVAFEKQLSKAQP